MNNLYLRNSLALHVLFMPNDTPSSELEFPDEEGTTLEGNPETGESHEVGGDDAADGNGGGGDGNGGDGGNGGNGNGGGE